MKPENNKTNLNKTEIKQPHQQQQNQQQQQKRPMQPQGGKETPTTGGTAQGGFNREKGKDNRGK